MLTENLLSDYYCRHDVVNYKRTMFAAILIVFPELSSDFDDTSEMTDLNYPSKADVYVLRIRREKEHAIRDKQFFSMLKPEILAKYNFKFAKELTSTEISNYMAGSGIDFEQS